MRAVLQQVQRAPIRSLGEIEIEHGNPVDRTVCPDCYSHIDHIKSCETCSGTGSVCPACRGQRFVMVPQHGGTSRYLYQECPRCCEAVQVPNDYGKRFADLPQVTRNPQREVYTILDWRQKHAIVEEEPF